MSMMRNQGGSDFWQSILARASLATGPTRVVVDRNTAAGVMEAAVTVVEFESDSVRVQSGAFTLAAATLSNTSTIPTGINFSRSALVFSALTTDATDDYFASSVRGRITGGTQLTFDRQGSSGTISGQWYVFESLDGAFTVQNVSTIITGTTQVNTTAITSVDMNQTFMITSYTTGENSDDSGEGSIRATLQNSTLVNVTRGNGVALTTGNTVNATTFVITLTGAEQVHRGTLRYAAGINRSSAAIPRVDINRSMAWGIVDGRLESDSLAADAIVSAHQFLNITNSTLVNGTRNWTVGAVISSFEVIQWGSIITLIPANQSMNISVLESKNASLNLSVSLGVANVTLNITPSFCTLSQSTFTNLFDNTTFNVTCTPPANQTTDFLVEINASSSTSGTEISQNATINATLSQPVLSWLFNATSETMDVNTTVNFTNNLSITTVNGLNVTINATNCFTGWSCNTTPSSIINFTNGSTQNTTLTLFIPYNETSASRVLVIRANSSASNFADWNLTISIGQPEVAIATISNLTVPVGGTNMTIINITNNGDASATNIVLNHTCVAPFTCAFNATGFNLAGGETRFVEFNASVPNGTSTQSLNVTLNATDLAGRNVTTTISLDVRNPANPVNVTITPGSNTTQSGFNTTFYANSTDINGLINNSAGHIFSVSNSSIASIVGNSTTNVTLLANQTGTVVLTIRNAFNTSANSTANLTVTANTPSRVTLTPASNTTTSGGNSTYTAAGFDLNGNANSSSGFIFTSSNSSIALIVSNTSTTVTVFANQTGTANITAASSLNTSANATSNLTVNANAPITTTLTPAANSTLQDRNMSYTATSRDAQGNTNNSAGHIFTVANTSVAFIATNTTTVVTVTGNLSGNTTIRAVNAFNSSANATSNITVVLVIGPAINVTITPGSNTSASGVPITFTAESRDDNNAVNNTGGHIFSISNSTIASITSNTTTTVTLTGNQTGTAVLTVLNAFNSSANSTANITIVANTPATVTLIPTSNTSTSGTNATYTATARDLNGNINNTSGFIFNTTNSSIGLIVSNTSTIVTVFANQSGTTNVSARSAFNSTAIANSTLTVVANTPSNITVSPTSNTSRSGVTAPFTATSRDAQGNVNNTAGHLFSVDNSSIASIQSNTTTVATLLANQTGTATLTITNAFNSSATTTATLTVTASTPTTVTLTPSTNTSRSGINTTYTAAGFDLNGNANNTNGFIFSTSNSSIGLIVSNTSTTVTVFANQTGTANITAASALNTSASANSTLIVIAGNAVTVTVSPTANTTTSGVSITYTVTARDAFGNVNNTGGFFVNISNSSIASLSSNNTNTFTFSANQSGTAFLNFTNNLNNSANASANMTVVAGSPSTVTLTPASNTTTSGTNTTFSANARDAQGNTNNSAGFIFNVSNSSVATIATNTTTNVTVFSNRSGFSNITAALASNTNISATSNLTVVAGNPVSVSIAPPNVTASPFTNVTFVGTATDPQGNTNNSAGFIFNISNTTVGTIVANTTTNVTVQTAAAGLANVTLVNAFNSSANASSLLNVTPDNAAPIITNEAAGSITTSSATITWTTDEASNSTVRYGLNSSSLTSNASDSTLVTSHSVSISGLSASTTYFFNVSSCDPSGNCNTTGPHSFTTAATGGGGGGGGGGGAAGGGGGYTPPITPAAPVPPQEPPPTPGAGPIVKPKAVIILPTEAFAGEFVEIFLKTLDGAPIKFANLQITFPSGRAFNVTTDEKGSIRFLAEESGIYTIEAIDYDARARMRVFTAPAPAVPLPPLPLPQQPGAQITAAATAAALPLAVILLFLAFALAVASGFDPLAAARRLRQQPPAKPPLEGAYNIRDYEERMKRARYKLDEVQGTPARKEPATRSLDIKQRDTKHRLEQLKQNENTGSTRQDVDNDESKLREIKRRLERLKGS
jgi:hypothetical protein